MHNIVLCFAINLIYQKIILNPFDYQLVIVILGNVSYRKYQLEAVVFF